MNNNPIGIFDSGVGGLTVFNDLIKIMPAENYIYFGDTKNVPYGSKTNEELIEIAKNSFDYFEQKKAKAVVMACNTTSAVVYDALKDNYSFEIYPIIQSASSKIAELNVSKIGIFATPATVSSQTYTKELKKYNPKMEVIEIACPEWVNIVENQTQHENLDVIKKYIDIMSAQNVQKIVLGCTHYPYLQEILSKFAPQEIFINPAKFFAKHIHDDLKNKNIIASEQIFKPKFLVSSEPEKFQNSAQLFFELTAPPELISLEKHVI